MDAGGFRNDLRYTEVGHVMERSGDVDQRTRDDDCWRLVDVLLSGGAPWGFTLRGGREHREPLLITKVEEGSKAAAVSLQVGDELVNINEVPLSGYRQEAICLVKGSHKTLALVVKRNMKMVDIVAQKMPSENDVHVARSFLTKILRSSMRRNEPVSRPHSWHSTKFNESQSETAKTQSPPTPVWDSRYDASSSSTDLSTGWEQTNLRRVSDQFSSLGSMDSLEHVPHAYPPGQLSPAKSNNSVEHLGGGKRDSAYSSFSTSSGTPDYTLSKSNAASTENMLYKVSQWDSGGKHNNVRNSQSLSEGVKQDERLGYLQMPEGSTGRDSPRTEEQPGSRHSSSSRASFGPVWHVPEKKKTASPSPPPPPPPVRSDSFAATKIHEKGLIIAYPQETDTHVHPNPYEKGMDRGSESSDNVKRTTESRRSYNLPPKNDNSYISPDNYNYNQLNSNKLCSLSSSDVRQGPPPHAYQPYHQWQYSDESTFHSQAKPSVPKPQNISGYYSSMQELPTNSSAQHQGRTPSGSLSTTVIDQNPDNSGHSRYYCVTTCQPSSNPLLGKVEDRKSSGSIEVVQTGNDRKSLSPQTVNKAKYQLPQQQQHHYPHSKDSNGYSKQEESLHHQQPPTVTPPAVLEASTAKPSSDERGGQRRHNSQSAEPLYTSYPPSKQAEQRRSLPLQQRELQQDIRHQTHESNKICPQTTPMLHSLCQETTCKDEKSRSPSFEESLECKQPRRSDRFATTLRNEIQMRKAKLQKSKSAAALTGAEAEEAQEVWKSKESSPTSSPSSLDNSFTSTYKDHLKEAQARVLKATSFRRRDLEPMLLEHPGAEALPIYPSSVMARKDVNPLPTVSESVISKSGSAGSQVTRIGGRKRFPTEKKVKSFSEPDKIHEVGVNEDLPPTEGKSSLVEQWKLFEATGRPAFSKPVPKQAVQSFSEDSKESKAKVLAPTRETEGRNRLIPLAEYTEEAQGGSRGTHKHVHVEQQRLGTFAEYEARWNIQKKPPETRASGRYRSADNILDPASEEKNKSTCVHERSRSSPSADFYGQKIPVPGRKSAEYSQPENTPADQDNTATRFSDRGHGDCRAREKLVELEHFPGPTPLHMPGNSPESMHTTAPAPVYHRPTTTSHNPVDSGLPHPEEHRPTSISHRPVDSGLPHPEEHRPTSISHRPVDSGLPHPEEHRPTSISHRPGDSGLPHPEEHRPTSISHRPVDSGLPHPEEHRPTSISHRPVDSGLPHPEEHRPTSISHRPVDSGPPHPEEHRPTSISHRPVDSGPPHPEEHSHIEPQSGPRKKAPLPQRPPLPNSRRPEITPPLSNSQESLTGSQGGAASPCSPNRDINPAPIPTHSPRRGSEQSKGLLDREQSVVHQVAPANPQPASPPLPSSYGPSALAAMDGQRSPSPQFAPQRLSDKPPVSLQDEDSDRMENLTDNNSTAVKKVPIKIVHSESVSERENRQYLLHNDATVAEAQGPGVTWVSSLGAPEQDYSVFCAYTRQREPSPDREQAAPQTYLRPQRDTDTNPLRDHISPNGQQPSQPTEQPNSNIGALNTGLSEDQKREELARDIMGKDRSLADILDQSKMRTTMDLMQGIFPQGEQLLEGAHQRRKVAPKQALSQPAERKEDDSLAAAVAVVTSSTYYSTSAPKAELLIKMKDMQEQEEEEDEEEEDELDIDLASKKQELIDSLSKKLQVLREARESLQEDILDNNALGDEVEATVQQVCKPNELDKFRMFVGDLDKVVSLLLSLSGRLARVENALNSLEEDASAEERRTLMEKRKLLIRQHEDAKELKENLDRRERVVYDILASYLSDESLTDYEHFVKMKSALIIEQRKLEDKIKLGEEQLKCLTDSLPLEQRMVL